MGCRDFDDLIQRWFQWTKADDLPPWRASTRGFEEALIRRALDLCGQNKDAAARMLNIKPSTLRERLSQRNKSVRENIGMGWIQFEDKNAGVNGHYLEIRVGKLMLTWEPKKARNCWLACFRSTAVIMPKFVVPVEDIEEAKRLAVAKVSRAFVEIADHIRMAQEKASEDA